MKPKAIFISTFISALVGASLWAGLMLGRGGFDLATLGVLVATGPFAAFLGYAFVGRSVARTGRNLPVLTGLMLTGLVLTLAGALMDGPNVLAMVMAFAIASMWVVYLRWYSVFGRTPSPVLDVGSPLPGFELQTADGKTVSSSEFRGRRKLLVFYRGNWCPLCMAQIEEVAGQYRELERRGVDVLLISPQPAGHTRSLSKRFDAPMSFMVDTDNKAARALGIAIDGVVPAGLEALGYKQETVLPTVVLVDANTNVIWRDETDNYRVRPEPQTFLAALDRAEAAA